MTRHAYRLVPLPFGETFALEGLNQMKWRAAGNDHGLDKGRSFAATIPAFSYSVEPPVPAEPLPSLGNRLLLVAHTDVSSKAVQSLVEAGYGGRFTKVIHPPA